MDWDAAQDTRSTTSEPQHDSVGGGRRIDDSPSGQDGLGLTGDGGARSLEDVMRCDLVVS